MAARDGGEASLARDDESAARGRKEAPSRRVCKENAKHHSAKSVRVPYPAMSANKNFNARSKRFLALGARPALIKDVKRSSTTPMKS